MALNYITSIFTGQSVFVEDSVAGAPTATAARGSIAIINVAGATAVYLNTSAAATGATWTQIGAASASVVSYDPARSGLVQEISGAPATTVQQAIDAIASGQIVADFVFNPNIAANVGNVYNDFEDLYVALSRVNAASRKRIQFIPLAATKKATIPARPAGGYDFRNTEWIGTSTGASNELSLGRVSVEIAAGAFVTAGGYPPAVIRNIDYDFQTGGAVFCTLPAGDCFTLFDNSVAAKHGITVAPFVIPATTEWTIKLINQSILQGFGGVALADVAAFNANAAYVFANSGSDVLDEVFNVPATSDVQIYSEGVTCRIFAQVIGATSGTLVPNYAGPSALWLATSPSSVANALDRLAASPSSEGMQVVADPGNGGTINPDVKDGEVVVQVAGAGETRIMALPDSLGQRLSVVADPAFGAGDATIDFGNQFDLAGNTTVQITAAFQGATFYASYFVDPVKLVWRLVSNDGCTLA